jgi:hypothetical protein
MCQQNIMMCQQFAMGAVYRAVNTNPVRYACTQLTTIEAGAEST